MKFRPRWPITILLLIFLVLISRLIWIASDLSIGSRSFGRLWVNQVRSLVNWQPPIALRTPRQQAAFWLQQATEVDAVNHDPQVALGSAWMLDYPEGNFILRHEYDYDDLFKEMNYSRIRLFNRDWKDNSIDQMLAEYEPLCREACLKQSELATSLAPDNLELWRNRALLLFQYKYQDRKLDELIPRRTDWLAVLDECIQHDPKNALYDYLAAIQLWNDSTEIKQGNHSNHRLKITQPETYQQARQRLRNGLEKPFFKSGFSFQIATFTFLMHTPVDSDYHITSAANRLGIKKPQLILLKLAKMLQWEVTAEVDQNQYQAAVMKARDQLRASEQISVDNTDHSILSMMLMIRFDGLKNLLKLQKLDPGLFEPTEVDSFSKQLSQTLVEIEVHHEVDRRKKVKIEPNYTLSFYQAMLLTVTSFNFVLITLVCILFAGLLSWICGRNANWETVHMGLWRPAVCWILGTGISLLVWGLFPAEIIPFNWQYWQLLVLVWTCFVLTISGILYLLRVGFSVPWSQIACLSIVLTFLVLILSYDVPSRSQIGNVWKHTSLTGLFIFVVIMLSIVILPLYQFREFIREKKHSWIQKVLICGLILLIPVFAVQVGTKLFNASSSIYDMRDLITPVTWRVLGGMYKIIGVPYNDIDLASSPLTKTWLIWYWHAGELFAVLISITIQCFWFLKRQCQVTEGGLTTLSQTRICSTISFASRMIAKSCAVVALICTLVYLINIPEVLRASDRQFWRNYQTVTDPAKSQEKFDVIYAEVKADQVLMKQIKKEVDADIQQFMKMRRRPDGETNFNVL